MKQNEFPTKDTTDKMNSFLLLDVYKLFLWALSYHKAEAGPDNRYTIMKKNYCEAINH